MHVPTSLWFHPLLSWSINALPASVPPNYRLWFISLLSAFGALIVVYEYTRFISPTNLKAQLLFLVPLLPGGLGIATSNAEFPCLLFTSLLAVSILRRWPCYHPLLWGTLAILAKPNAIYMIPALGVYLVSAIFTKDFKIVRNSLLGILSIIIVWLLWMLYVDIQMGQIGAYWQAREISSTPLSAGPLTFLQRVARVFVYIPDGAMHLRFATALVIPLVDMWILLAVPLKNETHRLSILASILAMVFVTLLINNPNKMIVYATTFPGHIAIGLLFLKQTFCKNAKGVLERPLERLTRNLAGTGYLIFCLSMMLFFVVGTPLEWYY
jgi:hypothetical protein